MSYPISKITSWSVKFLIFWSIKNKWYRKKFFFFQWYIMQCNCTMIFHKIEYTLWVEKRRGKDWYKGVPIYDYINCVLQSNKWTQPNWIQKLSFSISTFTNCWIAASLLMLEDIHKNVRLRKEELIMFKKNV